LHINLQGKVALVTGVGRGVGHEIMLTLAEEGVTTIALDVNPSDLAQVSEIFNERKYAGKTYLCDVRNYERIREIVQEVVQEYGRIDILVNNAGVTGDGLVETLDEAAWDFCFDVNLKGTFFMCKAVIPIMKSQRYGRILLTIT
jgi:3-oxoacyl-[acyl-carrier protein] reductase